MALHNGHRRWSWKIERSTDDQSGCAGNNVPQTPQDMQAAAASMANDLLGLPESAKRSELQKLKQFNPVLHSVVRAQMDGTRQQARSQGGAAMMQQQFGKA